MRHIPSWLNVLADSLSRKDQVIRTEWFLHPSIVKGMFSIWYTPELDLFATRHNHKLAAFVSPVSGSGTGCHIHSIGQLLGVHFFSDCHDAAGGSQATAFAQVPNGVGGAFASHSAGIVS